MKNRNYLKILKILIVPISLIIISNWFLIFSKDKELDAKYVEMSVKILMEMPNKNNIDIRDWAVKMLDHYSKIKFSSEVKKQLIEENSLLGNNLIRFNFLEAKIDESFPKNEMGIRIYQGKVGELEKKIIYEKIVKLEKDSSAVKLKTTNLLKPQTIYTDTKFHCKGCINTKAPTGFKNCRGQNNIKYYNAIRFANCRKAISF